MIQSDIQDEARGDTVPWKKSYFTCELDEMEVIVKELRVLILYFSSARREFDID